MSVLDTVLKDIERLFANNAGTAVSAAGEGYRTKDVRKILGCSVNKPAALSQVRKVRWKKIGGSVNYNREDSLLISLKDPIPAAR